VYNHKKKKIIEVLHSSLST